MDLPPTRTDPEHAAFARSVLSGLTKNPKSLEPRWLYDAVGAKLFEAITKLDHYYVTRTEMAVIENHADDIADALGAGVTIIEPGSGEAIKVRPLIEALGARADAYVPIDIASDQLDAVAKELSALYPDLTVRGIATDFFSPFKIDQPDNAVIFFPGSTVGNMTESAAVGFLRNLRRATGAKRFLIGFDLVKDRHVLEEAYDDPAGVTAAFTKNVLQRINRELGGTFDLDLFEFRADYEDEKSAVVMQLVAQEAHSVSVAGTTISFEAGETIHTEDSRKYTVDRFASFAKKAELVPLKTWTDKDRYFAVMLLDTIDA